MSDTEPSPGTEGYWTEIGADPDPEREPDRTEAQERGRSAEQYACDRWGLIKNETGYSDAERVEQTGETTPVQIKACRLAVQRPDSRARSGRFRLWDFAHTELVERGGVYLFLTYGVDEDDTEKWRGKRWIPADELEAAIGEISWYDTEHGHMKGRPYDVNWRRVFPEAPE